MSKTAAPRNLQQYTPSKILGNIAFQSTASVRLPNIDRTMMYRSINLKLTGSITNAGAMAQGNIGSGDEWGIVKAIKLVANGGQVLRSISGEALCILNYLLTGVAKAKNTLSSGGGATLPFSSVLPLWLILPNDISKFPIDTTLNAKRLSDLYIEITWGTVADIQSTAGTTLANCQIEVLAEQSYYIDPSVVPNFAATMLQTQTVGNNLPATGSGSAGNVWQIPVGQQYPFFLINSKQTGTNTDTTGSAFGTGLIQSGTNQLQYTDLDAEIQINRYRFEIQSNDFSAMFNNTKNNPGAWVLWLFARNGLLSEQLNLVNFQNCNAYIQTLGANADVFVTPLVVYPFQQIAG